MSISKIKIEEFLQLAAHCPLLDVRSPAEFLHAHIPGAYSLPLFSDDERKIVGTAYKQQSREIAIKLGLDFFGPKMRRMVEETEAIINTHNPAAPEEKTVLVHCWRGGMRSAGVAWLLDLYGFKVYTLSGGYRSFRAWALEQFSKTYPFHIIGGYTGSGKTEVLKALTKKGHYTVDLEAIAKHRGSAFGEYPNETQPGQEMFENLLAIELHNALQKQEADNREPTLKPIWLEDESQRIGLVNLPNALWQTMRSSPVYFLDIPFEERLEYITKEYGTIEKTELVNAIIRIQKRLGGLDTKNAVNHLLEGDIKACFAILLRYYDKFYVKSLNNREGLAELLHTIPCSKVNAKMNMQLLLNEKILS